MKSSILVTVPFTEKQKMKILKAADNREVIFCSEDSVTIRQIEEAEIIIGNLPVSMLPKAEKLKWLQLNSAGVDAYCKKGVLKEKVILTNASGAYDISVAENMVAATMTLMKQLYIYHDNQRQHIWRDEGRVLSAHGSCVLVLGLGNIGLNYARKMKAMGCYIIGLRKHIGAAVEGVDEVYTIDKLDDCLSRADIVAAVLPGTDETKGLLDRNRFAIMKKTAYLINMGRGNVVNSNDLCQALIEGKIAGALLDVTDPEPLPDEHPLWDAPGLYITPHVAGGFHIPITLEMVADICAMNLTNYLNHTPLINVIDRKEGY